MNKSKVVPFKRRPNIASQARSAIIPSGGELSTQAGGMTVTAGPGANITVGKDGMIRADQGDIYLVAGENTALISRPNNKPVLYLSGVDFPAGDRIYLDVHGKISVVGPQKKEKLDTSPKPRPR